MSDRLPPSVHVTDLPSSSSMAQFVVLEARSSTDTDSQVTQQTTVSRRLLVGQLTSGCKRRAGMLVATSYLAQLQFNTAPILFKYEEGRIASIMPIFEDFLASWYGALLLT